MPVRIIPQAWSQDLPCHSYGHGIGHPLADGVIGTVTQRSWTKLSAAQRVYQSPKIIVLISHSEEVIRKLCNTDVARTCRMIAIGKTTKCSISTEGELRERGGMTTEAPRDALILAGGSVHVSNHS
jgi:hypothetical protein